MFIQKGIVMTEEIKQTQNQTNKPISAMAVTSLVIGAIALVTSAIPIVNNASFFIAALGIIFGVVGAVGIFKGKKRPKALVVVAFIINVLSIIVVLCTQSFYGDTLKKAVNGPQATSNNSQSSEKTSEVKVGESITLDNNLELMVVSVQGGFKNYDGNAVTKVTMKYVNNSNKELSYNAYDWKAEDPQGAQTSQTIYSDSTMKANADNLQSGSLAPGGTVTGSLYFKGAVSKVLYSSNLSQQTAATWIV